MKLFFLLFQSLFLLSAMGQKTTTTFTDPGELYPRLITINDKMFSTPGSSNFHYVGCVDGNCKDGEGTYIAVSSAGYGSGPEYRFAKVDYWVVKGTFSQNGSKCLGKTYYRFAKLAQKRAGAKFRPTEDGMRFDEPERSMTPVYTGELTQAQPIGDNRVSLYYPNGKGSYVQGKESVFTSCSGDFFYGTPLYIEITYKYPKPFTSFKGYVGDGFSPILGTAVYSNGDVYTGSLIDHKKYGLGKLVTKQGIKKGIWDDEELMQELDVYVPDTNLLRTLYHSQQWNKELKLIYNPFYYHPSAQNATIKGRFIGEDGKDKDEKYTGNGIFVENSNNIYFGSFVNGKPEGFGSSNGGKKKLVFGIFKEGIFIGGGEAYDYHNKAYGRNELAVRQIRLYPGSDDLINGWKQLQSGNKKTPMNLYTTAAAAGNYEAMHQLGILYHTGNGVAKDDQKAEEWFVKAAVSKDYDMIYKIAQMYDRDYRGGFTTADWYKRAAGATDDKALLRECTNKYFSLKYPYLKAVDYNYITLDDEATIPDAATYAVMLEKRKERQDELKHLASLSARPEFATARIDITSSSLSVTNENNTTIKADYKTGFELQPGDFVWMESSFSQVTRGADDKLYCGSKKTVISNSGYFVIKSVKPVPYFITDNCYKCGGTGGTQGGTLTGGGFVSGHTTTITPTIVGGVSQVTTTATYGPPQSIYIPGSVCKACKGRRGTPRNATAIYYNGQKRL
jgi:hypothetical protein